MCIRPYGSPNASAGPVNPAAASSAARMAPAAADPEWKRLVQAPSLRYAMLPADMLSATPNAARRAAASSPASRPAAAAAPNTPQTAVGCSPCRYSSAGPSSSPRLAMTWYPVPALSSPAAGAGGAPGAPAGRGAPATASRVVQMTVPGCELDG